MRRFILHPSSFILLFAALSAATHYLCMGGRFWTGWDDAFITYRFVENAIGGHWFVWNLGEPPVYAFTSLSYFLLLIPCAAIGLSLPVVSLVLGFLFHGLAAYLATRFPPFTGGQKGGLLTGLILACDWYSGWATTGLETWLFVSLVFAALLAYQHAISPPVHGGTKGGSLYSVAILCALLAWTRPDGLILPAIILIHFLWRATLECAAQKRQWKNVSADFTLRFRLHPSSFILHPFLVFFSALLPAIAIPWLFTGSPLPVSMAAKSAHVVLGLMNPLNPDNLYTNVGWWPFALAIFALLAVLRRRRDFILHPSSFILFSFALANFSAYWLFGLPGFAWYYVPILACLLAVACASFPPTSVGGLRGVSFRLHLLVLAVIVFGSLQLSYRTAWLGPEITRGNFQAYHDLARQIPPGKSLAAMNVGILGYESCFPPTSVGGLRGVSSVYDLQALTSPDLLPALARRDLDAMLDMKRPDYVLVEIQAGAAGQMSTMFLQSATLRDTTQYRQVFSRRIPRDLLFLLKNRHIP